MDRKMRKPAWYREEDNRLVKMYTMVDLRKLASVYRYMSSTYGIRVSNRSHLLRTVLEFTYQLLSGRADFHRIETHKEAFLLLDQHGLVPRKGQDYDTVQAAIQSERFDLDRAGTAMKYSQQSVEDEYEEIKSFHRAFLERGIDEEQVDSMVQTMCEEKGVSYEQYRRKTDWRTTYKEPTARKDTVVQNRTVEHTPANTTPVEDTPDEPTRLLRERLELYKERGYDENRIHVGLSLYAKELGVDWEDYQGELLQK